MKTLKFTLASLGAAGLICSAAFTAPSAHAWGKIGHRITGQIAETYLTDEARQAIIAILGVESLAEASTYPDEMRSNPDEYWQKTASPFHYVTVHDDERGYHVDDCPPQGDAVSALKEFTATLTDTDASLADKQLALRFIVHIIGDLHQPLHVGSAARDDKGGNDVKVTFFGQRSNLHRVWDSELVEHQKLSYTEFSHWLQRAITNEQYQQWNTADAFTWVNESADYRETVYPPADQDPYLSWQYVYDYTPLMKQRLQQGGVRIAAYLNHVFAAQ